MTPVPYTTEPPWARRVLYCVRAAAYSMLLTSGVGAWLLTPTTVADRLPPGLSAAWGLIAVGGGALALFGSLTRRYRWELVGLPFLTTAFMIYAGSVWHIVIGAPTRLAQSAAITGLLALLVIRYVDLLRVSRRLRAEHDRER